MNLKHERIEQLCQELKLLQVITNYPYLSQEATRLWSFSNYLEALLKEKKNLKHNMRKTILTKMAGFPAIKTLDQFDFKFVQRVPKKTTARSRQFELRR